MEKVLFRLRRTSFSRWERKFHVRHAAEEENSYFEGFQWLYS